MAERFEKINELSTANTEKGHPVNVEEGKILRDTQTDEVLIQLNLRNTGDENLKSCTVKVTTYDSNKEVIEEIDREYNEKCILPNETFGVTSPIWLNKRPDSFDAVVIKIVKEKNEVVEEPVANEPVKVQEPKEKQKPKKAPKQKKKKAGGLIAIIIILVVLIGAAAVIYFMPQLGIRCMIFGHKVTDTYMIEKEPTCIEEGFKRGICDVCGKEMKKEKIEKTGHDFEDGYCTICGERDPDIKFVVGTTTVMTVEPLEGLNLRESSTTESERIGFMPYGTYVVVKEKSGTWVKTVKYGMTGWCSSDYLVSPQTMTSVTCTETEIFTEMKEHVLGTLGGLKGEFGDSFTKGDMGEKYITFGPLPYLKYSKETTPILFLMARIDGVQGDSGEDTDFIRATAYDLPDTELLPGIYIGDTLSDIEGKIGTTFYAEQIEDYSGTAHTNFITFVVNDTVVKMYFDSDTEKLILFEVY